MELCDGDDAAGSGEAGRKVAFNTSGDNMIVEHLYLLQLVHHSCARLGCRNSKEKAGEGLLEGNEIIKNITGPQHPE